MDYLMTGNYRTQIFPPKVTTSHAIFEAQLKNFEKQIIPVTTSLTIATTKVSMNNKKLHFITIEATTGHARLQL